MSRYQGTMGRSIEPHQSHRTHRTRTSAPSTLTTSEAQAPWGHRYPLRTITQAKRTHMLIQMFDKFKPQFLAKPKIHQNYTCRAACTVLYTKFIGQVSWIVMCVWYHLITCESAKQGAISTDLLLRCHPNHPIVTRIVVMYPTCGFLFVKSYNVIHIHEAKNVFCASHMHRNACIWSIIVTYIISGERHRWN